MTSWLYKAIDNCRPSKTSALKTKHKKISNIWDLSIFKCNRLVQKVRVISTLCRNCTCNSKALGLESMSNVDTRCDANRKKTFFYKLFVAQMFSSGGSLSSLHSWLAEPKGRGGGGGGWGEWCGGFGSRANAEVIYSSSLHPLIYLCRTTYGQEPIVRIIKPIFSYKRAHQRCLLRVLNCYLRYLKDIGLYLLAVISTRAFQVARSFITQLLTVRTCSAAQIALSHLTQLSTVCCCATHWATVQRCFTGLVTRLFGNALHIATAILAHLIARFWRGFGVCTWHFTIFLACLSAQAGF